MPSRKRRFSLLLVVGLVLAVALGSVYAIFTGPNYDRLNLLQRYLVWRAVNQWGKQLRAMPEEKRVLVEYEDLLGQLNFIEKKVVQGILSINPRELGFHGRFHSLEKPDNLVEIAPKTYRRDGREKSTGIQYCPAAAYKDYLKMMAQMRQDIGRELFIESGYRSGGFQAYNFLLYLADSHGFSLLKTARLNALPGYSEHQDPVNSALDFINAEGINGDKPQTPEDFERLPEYQWLVRRAHEYNFHLSYPRNNLLGVSFEPWHWHREKPRSSNPAAKSQTN